MCRSEPAAIGVIHTHSQTKSLQANSFANACPQLLQNVPAMF